MFDEDPWFEPKQYGIGSSMPIAWQGWALIAMHVGFGLVAVVLVAHDPFAKLVTVIIASAIPMPIYAAKTRGGWKWRWGQKD